MVDIPETQEIVAKAVHAAKAYEIRPDHPFIYVSKIISPDYVDIRLLNGDPQQRDIVMEETKDIITKLGPSRFFAFCGYVTADLTFGGILSDWAFKPYFYVRDSEKGHGAAKRIEGVKPEQLEGKEVLHIGDLLTRGTTSKKLADVMKETGATLKYHVPIFDRLQGGREALSELGIEVHPACIMDDSFYQTGIKAGLITEKDFEEVQSYRADNTGWATNYLRNNTEFFRRELQKPGIIENGEIKTPDVLEVLTVGYPQLKDEFAPYIRGLLKELGVTQPVPDFEYRV